MKIFLSQNLTITEAPEWLVREIEGRLTIPNPAYEDAVRMGRWTGDLKPTLRYYRHEGDAIITPRGFIRQVVKIAQSRGVSGCVFDRRRTLPEVDFAFKGTLKPYQKAALADILKRDSDRKSVV